MSWPVRFALLILSLMPLAACEGGVDSSIKTPTFGTALMHGTWQSLAPMPTPRSTGTAAVVGTKIYTIGGGTTASVLATVEEYDTATNTWTNCGGFCDPMPTALSEITAATANGIVYLFGGYTGSFFQEFEYIFNPSLPNGSQWSNCSCAIPLGGGDSFGQGAVVAVNGALYAVGGNSHLNVFQFNPALLPGSPWINCGGTCSTMPGQRNRMGNGVLANGLIYIFGGFNGGWQNTFDTYDVTNNVWSACGSSCPSLSGGEGDSATASIGGLVYHYPSLQAAYGGLLDSYDPAQNAWTHCGGQCPAKPTLVDWPFVAVVNGKLYLMGGGSPLPPGSTVGANEVFTP